MKKPFLNQNQTGGNLGGPIKKDKLFFYANYELFLLKQQSGQQRTILTADADQGIFTYLNNGAVQKVTYPQRHRPEDRSSDRRPSSPQIPPPERNQ